MVKIVIPGELTDLNEYIRQERGNKYAGANTKRTETDYVCWTVKQRYKPIRSDKRVRVLFTWFCKNQRKDPDNIAFAKKFILDGLVTAGILEGDGWKYIKGLSDDFEVDKEFPRIEVEII